MKSSIIKYGLLCIACLTDQPLHADGSQPADMTKPVKVYILLGQSNMLGFGTVSPVEKQGTLEYLTQTDKKYPNIVDNDGNWAIRKDVRYTHVMQGGDPFQTLRNEWLTVASKHVGPELQFGHLLGDYHEEPVLILKACIGNRSIGWDLLPPGSKRFEYRGKTYAGYRDAPFSWVEGDEGAPVSWKDASWYAGKQYDDDTSYAKAVIKDLGTYYPGAKEYEIAGFVFWQGHKDQTKILAPRYELNLVNFIKALRKDFNAPNAPFACATIAFNGRKIAGAGLTIVKAQLAVSGDKGKYPEFKGNVKTVDARKFWKPRRRSPGGGTHHYNGNAQTYMDVGDALGEAMIGLLKNDETPKDLNTQGNRKP